MASDAPTLIRGREVATDEWQRVALAAPLPEGDVIVPWARWVADADALRAHKGRLGVQVPSPVNPADHPDLEGLALIALEFPKFADGRGYTYARLLRERRGFTGEIRAVGDILRDQLLYLWRCGVNAFELTAGRDPQDALRAFEEFSVDYQPGTPARAGR